MNLNAATKKTAITLWQTPTQISYTILPRSVGEVTGVKAKDAIERYMEWVAHSTNGSWESLEDLEEAKHRVNDHLEYVRQFLHDKTLRVWVM